MKKNIYNIGELKKDSVKDKIGKKIQDGKEWVRNNKETLIMAAPIVMAGVGTLVKVSHKHLTLRKQRLLKELYCYDPSLGHYWRLKRELSNNEWITIDRRKMNGERLSEILSQMNLLK